MTDMTEEEADTLDEYFTKNLPRAVPGKGGVTTRQGFRMAAIDQLSEKYLLTMALAAKKLPQTLSVKWCADGWQPSEMIDSGGKAERARQSRRLQAARIIREEKWNQ